MTDLEQLINEVPPDYRAIWGGTLLTLTTAWMTRQDLRKCPAVIRKIQAGEEISRKEAGHLLGAVCGVTYMIVANAQTARRVGRGWAEARERIQAQAREEREKEDAERKKREAERQGEGPYDRVARDAVRAEQAETPPSRRRRSGGGATVA